MNLQNSRRSFIIGGLVLIASVLSACGDSGDGGSTGGNGDTPITSACSTHLNFFQTSVWPILQTRCFVCHEVDKVSSDLNLVDAAITDYQLLNFNNVKSVAAKTDANQQSLFLTKPSNSNLNHSGGLIIARDSAEYQTFSELVDRVSNCVDKSQDISGLATLTPYQQLRKMTLSLAGRLPTTAEEQAINTAATADNAIVLTQAMNSQMDGVMTENNFYTRLQEIFNDLLLLDAYPGASALGTFDLNNFNNKDFYGTTPLINRGYSSADSNTIRRNAGKGLARAPLELITYVVRNNRPFTEILTANYLLVNPYSATLLGANVGDATFNFQYGDSATQHNSNDFRPAVITDNNARVYPHAGILSTLTFMTRYPSTNSNRNRARSRYVFLYFLDTNVEGLADRSGLDLDNVIGTFPPFQDPQCRACHDTVDPMAGLFKNWTNRGRYQGDYGEWYDKPNPPQMLPPGYPMDPVDQLPTANSGAALQWLASKITADGRFALAVVKTVFKGVTGQVPPADVAFTDSLKSAFINNNYNIKVVFKLIVNSIYFTADNLGTDKNPADYAEIGMAHLLTPEQLDRKIRAVTGGYAWRSPSNRSLRDLTTYNLLYGGIDSTTVTERTTDPTTLITGVQARIAAQTSCETVAVDFNTSTSNRKLFPLVEISDSNDTQLGTVHIKENIKHLFKQLLGEELSITDADIDRAYNLFVAVRLTTPNGEIPQDCRGGLPAGNAVRVDSNKTVRPWMAVVTYLLSDYAFFYE